MHPEVETNSIDTETAEGAAHHDFFRALRLFLGDTSAGGVDAFKDLIESM